MSLVAAIAYSDNFVLVTTDTKVVEWDRDEETFEFIDGRIRETELVSRKAVRVTEKVIFSTTGDHSTGERLRVVLQEELEWGDSLDQAANILNRLVLGLLEEADAIRSKGGELPWQLNCLVRNGVTLMLYGFDNNYLAGMAKFELSERRMEVVKSPWTGPYVVSSQSPDTKRDREIFETMANFPKEHRNLPNFLNAALSFHVEMYNKHQAVGDECIVHLLVNEKRKISYTPVVVQLNELIEAMQHEA